MKIMRNKILPMLLVTAAAFWMTGCGQREGEQQKETQVQPPIQIETETPTEAIVIAEVMTEAPTEAVTEVMTEAPTEAPTEPARVFPENLTSDEEQEYETELPGSVTYYANDDINIRLTPDTENSDNIVSSYDQGEEVVVIGETPHWYKVSKEDWTGYVYKNNLSETAVDPKTPEERSEAAENAPAVTVPAAGAETANDYAESFTIQMASDANIRAEASDQGNIIGTVAEGSVITAVGESDNWYRVDVDGTVGYVSKNLVLQ